MIILNYHYFGKESTAAFVCGQKDLEAQLSYLVRHCHVVPLLDALKCLESGERLLPRTVALTVDDCDASFYQIGWPVFRNLGLPLLCNVITGCLGRRLNMGCEVEIMRRVELEEIVASGLVVLGTHSVSHSRFNELDPARVADELNNSKKVVESLQGHCSVFCYPYGSMSVVTADSERLLIELGYRYALTTCGGSVNTGTARLRLGRLNITGSVGKVRFPFYCNGVIGKLIHFKKGLWGERFYRNLSPGGRIGDPGPEPDGNAQNAKPPSFPSEVCRPAAGPKFSNR